jgi:phosphoserine aminotransferase
MVCDMSSNIASKPIDWDKYDVVYAGAQKNLGPAGLTVVIIRNKILDEKNQSKKIPATSDWNLFRHAPNMVHNTPCCFAIYVCGLNVAHMLKQGGIPKMQELAEKRSSLLYAYLDSSEGYY